MSSSPTGYLQIVLEPEKPWGHFYHTYPARPFMGYNYFTTWFKSRRGGFFIKIGFKNTDWQKVRWLHRHTKNWSVSWITLPYPYVFWLAKYESKIRKVLSTSSDEQIAKKAPEARKSFRPAVLFWSTDILLLLCILVAIYRVFQLEFFFWIACYFGRCHNKRCHFLTDDN